MTVIKIGDIVKITGKHPWSGRTGEVIRFSNIPIIDKIAKWPVVRVHDSGDHECVVTDVKELKVLK